MSYDIPGLVETSTNLATVAERDGALEILMSNRSSVATALRAVQGRLRALGELAGAKVESLDGYHRDFGITMARLRGAKPDAIVMHPGPMNRGVEITDEVADGPQSVILRQVANGVKVRRAVLERALG